MFGLFRSVQKSNNPVIFSVRENHLRKYFHGPFYPYLRDIDLKSSFFNIFPHTRSGCVRPSLFPKGSPKGRPIPSPDPRCPPPLSRRFLQRPPARDGDTGPIQPHHLGPGDPRPAPGSLKDRRNFDPNINRFNHRGVSSTVFLVSSDENFRGEVYKWCPCFHPSLRENSFPLSAIIYQFIGLFLTPVPPVSVCR